MMRTEECKEHVGVWEVLNKTHSEIATTLMSVCYKRAKILLATAKIPQALLQGGGDGH